MRSYAVLGAGSWGTALACLLARNGNSVHLWGRDHKSMLAMQADRVNARYLPACRFPESLICSDDFNATVVGANVVLLAVPCSAFGATLGQLMPMLHANQGVVWSSKGLEPGTGRFLHAVIDEHLGLDWPTAIVSGPSFAREVALDVPTAVTVASRSVDFARRVADDFHNPRFRAYTSNDVVGVEVGGCVKNVMAIAAGIADGLGFGANTRAALLTRGLAEIVRLGLALGGKLETFMGLTGVGDLILTCTDDQSRNRRLGLALGRGESLDAAMATIGQAVEGARSVQEILRVSTALQIEMPICDAVAQVIYHNKPPMEVVQQLLARDPKPEFPVA